MIHLMIQVFLVFNREWHHLEVYLILLYQRLQENDMLLYQMLQMYKINQINQINLLETVFYHGVLHNAMTGEIN